MRNSVRVPPRMFQRAAALAPLLQANPGVADVLGGDVTPQAVLRAALVRGLRAMEAEYASPASPGVAPEPGDEVY